MLREFRVAVDRSDSRTAVLWRLTDVPGAEEQYRSALAAHGRDTIGFPGDGRKILGDLLASRSVRPGAHDVSLSDDRGTDHRSVGGGSGGDRHGRTGRADFLPAVPDAARHLT
jgi:hypothetical protein